MKNLAGNCLPKIGSWLINPIPDFFAVCEGYIDDGDIRARESAIPRIASAESFAFHPQTDEITLPVFMRIFVFQALRERAG